MKKHQLIWDLDDTLIITNAEFVKTNEAVAEMISSAKVGDNSLRDEILVFQRKLDIEMVKHYGFAPIRYLKSWIETFNHYSSDKGNAYLQVSKRIEELVANLYDRKFSNVPEALEVLSFLKDQGYPMIVLTAGDDAIQKKRVKESGVMDFVDAVYVEPYKTPETLKTLLAKYPAENQYMIGNSLKSDIYPALENDIWGIHVVRETWEADHHDIDKSHPRYRPIQTLHEVPKILQTVTVSL